MPRSTVELYYRIDTNFMTPVRAIDKLKQAFSVEERSSYSVFKGDELVLKIFWTPLTIADRDTINSTLIAMNKGQDEGSLDFALQVIVTKAEDESGVKMFTASLPALRREIPLSVLLDIMTKMQGVGEERRCRKSCYSFVFLQFFIAEKLGYTHREIEKRCRPKNCLLGTHTLK